MMTHRPRHLHTRLTLSALSLLLAVCLPVSAQYQAQYDESTPPQHAAGLGAVGSYTGADLGALNLTNGALNFRLPLGSVSGRGFTLPLTLNYSSKVWSASRSTDLDSYSLDGEFPVAYAAYNDIFSIIDLYSLVAPGWTVGAAPTLIARGTGIGVNPTTGCGYNHALTKLTVILPDKGEIQLRDDQTDGSPLRAVADSGSSCYVHDGYRGRRWHATDGSGVVFIGDNDNGVTRGDLAGVLITADGVRYRFVSATTGYGSSVNTIKHLARATSITDRNGNTIQISYPTGSEVRYTDQLGRITTIQKNIADPDNPSVTLALLISFPGSQGQTRYVKVKGTVMNQRYRAGINPVLPVINGDYDPQAKGYTYQTATRLFPYSYGSMASRVDNQTVLSELILPNGRALQFFYNEYGEVAEVQFPTGGKVQYDYQYMSALPAGKSLPGEVMSSRIDSNVSDIERAITARRVYPDGATLDATWSYSYTTGTAQVSATSAAGTVLLNRKHYFLASGRYIAAAPGTGPVPDRGIEGSGYTLWSTGSEYRTEMLDAAGTVVLAKVEQDWSQRAAVVWPTTTTGFSQQQPENDNRVNEERRFLETGAMARATTLYDQFNNPTEAQEYDFDASLKRRTVTSYMAVNPVNNLNYTSDAIRLLRLPAQQSVYDAAGVEQARTTFEYDNYATDANHALLVDRAGLTGHDAAFTTSYQPRGNVTGTTRYLLSNGNVTGSLSTYAQYDIAGNAVKGIDGRSQVSTVSFTDNFADGVTRYTYAFPTQTTSPVPDPTNQRATNTPLVASTKYDFSTGLATSTTDANNQVMTFEYNDVLDRLTRVNHADGGWMRFTYSDDPNNLYLRTEILMESAPTERLITTYQYFNKLGRAVRAFHYDAQDGANPWLTSDTQYDALGRVWRVAANPYRSTGADSAINPSGQWTTTSYDALGRVRTVTTADGAVARTDYDGARVLVTDHAGKQRLSQTDALGRLTDVWEVTAADGWTESLSFPNRPEVTAGYRTSYLYDALSNLRRVTQGSQQRFFAYDSLSRLIRAKNPEQAVNGALPAYTDPATGNSQWSMSYSYDTNSNLTTRTDARNSTTSYQYDNLNRVIRTDYSDGTPFTLFTYDFATNGRGRFYADYESSVTGMINYVT